MYHGGVSKLFDRLKRLFGKKNNNQNTELVKHMSEVFTGNGMYVENGTEIDSLTKIAISLCSTSKYNEFGIVVGENEVENAILEYVNSDEYTIICDGVDIKKKNISDGYCAVETGIDDALITYYKTDIADMIGFIKGYVDDFYTSSDFDFDMINEVVNNKIFDGKTVVAIGVSNKKLSDEKFPDDLKLVSLVVVE